MNKILLLLALLLPSVCFSQTISRTYPESPRRDSLQAAVYAQLNIKAGGSRKITDAVVTKALNRGAMATCVDYPALEKIDTVLFSRNDTGASGTLPADFHRLRKVWRLRGDTLMLPVTIIDPDSVQFYKEDRESYRHEKANPMSPDLCWTHGEKLRVYPKFVGKSSTTTDTIQISYFALDSALTDDTVKLAMNPDYIRKVVYYACGDICATRERFNEAIFYFQRYGGQSAIDRIEEMKK